MQQLWSPQKWKIEDQGLCWGRPAGLGGVESSTSLVVHFFSYKKINPLAEEDFKKKKKTNIPKDLGLVTQHWLILHWTGNTEYASNSTITGFWLEQVQGQGTGTVDTSFEFIQRLHSIIEKQQQRWLVRQMVIWGGESSGEFCRWKFTISREYIVCPNFWTQQCMLFTF